MRRQSWLGRLTPLALVLASGCVEDRVASPASSADDGGGETGGAPAAASPPAVGAVGTGPSGPPGEASEGTCADGQDNDGDGFVDCDDYDCCGWARCGCDGTCANKGACREPLPPLLDGDVDPSVGVSVPSDREGGVQVGAGGGGLTTGAGSDPHSAGAGGAAGATAEGQGETRCTDGLDDDGDGFVDCMDYDCCGPTTACGCEGGCTAARACARPNPGVAATETRCADGLDDDGDGFVDCMDYDCCGPTTACGCGGGCVRAWACQ